MIFMPKNRNRIGLIATVFPLLKFGNSFLQYDTQFKYLSHIITHSCSDDDDMYSALVVVYTAYRAL